MKKLNYFRKLKQFLRLKESMFMGMIEITSNEYIKLKINYVFRYFFYTICYLLGFISGGIVISFVYVGLFWGC